MWNAKLNFGCRRVNEISKVKIKEKALEKSYVRLSLGNNERRMPDYFQTPRAIDAFRNSRGNEWTDQVHVAGADRR